MTDILPIAGILLASWGTLWWKMGRMEARVNGTLGKMSKLESDWAALKSKCPLCTEKENA